MWEIMLIRLPELAEKVDTRLISDLNIAQQLMKEQGTSGVYGATTMI